MMRIRKTPALLIGAILLYLALSLTACSNQPRIEYRERPVLVPEIQYKPSPVDWSLLRTYDPVSASGIRVNGDLLDAFIEANARIGQCNADKVALQGLLVPE